MPKHLQLLSNSDYIKLHRFLCSCELMYCKAYEHTLPVKLNNMVMRLSDWSVDPADLSLSPSHVQICLWRLLEKHQLLYMKS